MFNNVKISKVYVKDTDSNAYGHMGHIIKFLKQRHGMGALRL